ncbi:MAG: helix-turn-helix transcriptional regulator [Treponema sp.]|nr:helix-turn-helix transcriptional regulator [Treponema sp.]
MKAIETCDSEVIHEDVVKKVKATFPKDELIFDLADFYKIFGDTTRVKILYALDKSELCVCDISALLGMSVSAVSHQLKTLRDSNLVKTKREGKVVYYSLSDDHVKSILECGIEHLTEIAVSS